MRDAIVIINQESGQGMALPPEQEAADIRQRFRKNGWLADVHIVRPRDIQRTIREAIKARPSALVVGGGDGTALTAVSVMDELGRVPLGILPMGTFNSLARDLDLPTDWFGAIDTLTDCEIRNIDVARVNGRPFLLLCALGFLGHADEPEVDAHLPSWVKSTHNILTTMQSYVDFPQMDMEVVTDGVPHHYQARFIGISNNPLEDQPGVLFPSRESVNCGKLAVYISTHESRIEIVRAGVAFMTGSLMEDPSLSYHEASSITVDIKGQSTVPILLDGETTEAALPLRFEIDPQGLDVFAP